MAILTFFKSWKLWVLLAVIAAASATLWKYQHNLTTWQDRAIAAERLLTQFTNEAEKERVRQEEANRIKLTYAEENLRRQAQSSEQIYLKVKQDYETLKKTNVATVADLRSQLRDAMLAANSIRFHDATRDSQTPAGEGSDCDATLVGQYETLVAACIITTQDYNDLRGWADEVKLIYTK